MTEIVPTTLDHLVTLYGEPPKLTVRAKTAIRDGEVYGIGGVYVEGGNRYAFIKFKDYEDMRAIAKLGRAVRAMFSNGVIAIRDTSLEKSESFLEHWGFRRIQNEVWIC